MRQFLSEFSPEALDRLEMDNFLLKDDPDIYMEFFMSFKWSKEEPDRIRSKVYTDPLPPYEDCQRLKRELRELKSQPAFRSIRVDADGSHYNVPLGTLQYWSDAHEALKSKEMFLHGYNWLTTLCYNEDSVPICNSYVYLRARL